MADITRALRRPLVWTLVAVLAAATLTGCFGGDEPPETTSPPVDQTQGTGSAVSTVSEPDDDTIRDELTRLTREWLDGFAEPTVADLNCPGTNAKVDVAGADGAPSKDLLACLVPPAGKTGWHLRVRNLSGVPVTIWGSSTLLAWTVQPDATFDVPMVNPRFGVPSPSSQSWRPG
jgi:hypothetical protein